MTKRWRKGQKEKNVDSKMRGQEVRAEELKTNTSKKKKKGVGVGEDGEAGEQKSESTPDLNLPGKK